MQVIPSIDIKDGQCVRLTQGNFQHKKVYDNSPLDAAQHFIDHGAKFLHVVDLDGALHGAPKNGQQIRDILELSSRYGVSVEVSGGIRTKMDVEHYLAFDPWQIILGSIAVFDPRFVQYTMEEYGANHFSIALDSKDGMAAARGWMEKSDKTIDSVAIQLRESGVKRFIFTDTSRDGTMSGVNVDETVRIKSVLGNHVSVIASGGVNSIHDVRRLHQAGIDGVIIGKALYENAIEIEELAEFMNIPV